MEYVLQDLLVVYIDILPVELFLREGQWILDDILHFSLAFNVPPLLIDVFSESRALIPVGVGTDKVFQVPNKFAIGTV